MSSKLDEMIRSMSGNREMFEPSEFDDPVAMQTDWTPTKRGGTNFRSHKLAEPNSERLEFRLTTGAKLIYLIFLVAGLVMAIASFCMFSFGEGQNNREALCLLGFGLVFMIVGGCVFYIKTAPIVFDSRRGFFWNTRKNPELMCEKRNSKQVAEPKKVHASEHSWIVGKSRNTLKHFAELEKVHALQIIAELCSNETERGRRTKTYHSYELNLVLEDGKRINVIDHKSQDRLREDAGTISAFLDKPIWDAT